MDAGRTTCWTLVSGARAGDVTAREEFSRRYLPVVRAYLRRRWSGTRWLDELDDAVQELFLECFRADGILARADPARSGGFRAYLYGAARNIAARVETRAARRRDRAAGDDELANVIADEATLSRVFDRAWALALIREAIAALERRAGDDAGGRRHAELLRLRFADGLAVREIASRWGEDPARVHRAYAAARDAFKKCLLDVVREHHPGLPGEVERQCAELLALLAG